MTQKQREQYFKKQQEALVRINKINPVTEVVNMNFPEQTTIDVSKPLLDNMFDCITASLGVHDLVLDYEPDEDDVYDEMPTEKTIQAFFRRF